MRWMLLFLLTLNAFYYVWHQQQVPVRAGTVAQLQERERQNIRLLNESGAGVTARKSVGQAQDEVVSNACMFLGRFESGARADELRQRLVSLDIRSDVRRQDVSVGTDYWVYLPPVASRAASLRQLKELQARMVDSFLITTGELENGISLGVFSRRDSAESHRQRMVGAGYQASIKAVSRAERSYWVRIDQQSRRLAGDQLMGQLAVDFKDLQQQIMPCEGIATSPWIE